MNKLSRRDFTKLCSVSALGMALPQIPASIEYPNLCLELTWLPPLKPKFEHTFHSHYSFGGNKLLNVKFEFEKEATVSRMSATNEHFLYFAFLQESEKRQLINGHLFFSPNAPWIIRLYGGPKHMYSIDLQKATKENAVLETDWCRISASLQTFKIAPCSKTQEVFLKDSINLNNLSISRDHATWNCS